MLASSILASLTQAVQIKRVEQRKALYWLIFTCPSQSAEPDQNARAATDTQLFPVMIRQCTTGELKCSYSIEYWLLPPSLLQQNHVLWRSTQVESPQKATILVGACGANTCISLS